MADKAPAILGIHHSAFRCRDAEETRRFYQDILGLRTRAALRIDNDPLTGQPSQYLHLFFEMGDKNYIAFFDAPDSATPEKFAPDHPFDLHYAMEVSDKDQLMSFKSRLEAHGLQVFGPLDHGFCHSIYFYDPNGLALEFTCRDVKHDAMLDDEEQALDSIMEQWTRDTAEAKRRLQPTPAPAQAAE